MAFVSHHSKNRPAYELHTCLAFALPNDLAVTSSIIGASKVNRKLLGQAYILWEA
jgi:hypothetical protein